MSATTRRVLVRAAALACVVALLQAAPAGAAYDDPVGEPTITGPTSPVSVNPDTGGTVRFTVHHDADDAYVWWGRLRMHAVPGQEMTFDLTGAPEESHKLVVTICRPEPEPETGMVCWWSTPEASTAMVTVDRTAPVLPVEQSQRTFYPVPDGYRDAVAVAPATSEPGVSRRLVVRDASGTVVRTADAGAGAVAWEGLDDNRTMVPAGTYRPEVTATDAAGNQATMTGGELVVSAQRLITQTWTRTVTAASTLRSRTTLRCASVTVPGRRAWKGSVGYDSGRGCRTAALGRHSLRLPASVTPARVVVAARGAASPSRPRSTALLAVADQSGRLLGQAPLGARLGTRAVGAPVAGDGSLGWRVSTSGGSRYDVASFVLTYRYTRLG